MSRGILNGDRKAISKAITAMENNEENSVSILKEIFSHTGHAFVIGITGPPGTGKSSVIDRMLRIYRAKGQKVAVLAVDPSSPLSGGALLGDRVRMISHTLDEGVYIRSMASRGNQGGLSQAVRNSSRILDAAGIDLIVLETVGIGQSEVEVVKVADVVIIVLMPELGDEVQAMKAGLMEIGDIFAVNKSDLPGADKVLYDIDSALTSRSGWRQSALKISAKSGEGFEELVSKIEDYRSFYQNSKLSETRKVENAAEELIENVSASLARFARTRLEGSREIQELAREIASKDIDPESATKLLLRSFSVNVEAIRGRRIKRIAE